MPVTAAQFHEKENNSFSQNSFVKILHRAAPIYGTIGDNEVKPYAYQVRSGSTTLEVELTWQRFPSDNDLRLEVIAPNGQNYGTYSDGIDGSNNGEIPLTISSGNLQIGTWTIRVHGHEVTGTQSFTLVMNDY